MNRLECILYRGLVKTQVESHNQEGPIVSAREAIEPRHPVVYPTLPLHGTGTVVHTGTVTQRIRALGT